MANHSAVAHAWAHQTGKQRKGYNMFYEGPSIYSHGHHWELARLIDLPSGGRGVMLYEPSRTRSVSTHTHLREAQSATSHLKQFWVQSFEDHETNYTAFIDYATESVGKATRARKYGQSYLESAEGALRQANEYNYEFELGHAEVTLANLAGFTAELQAEVNARRAAYEAERDLRERERIREARAEAKPYIRAWLRGELPLINRYRTPRPLCRVKGDVVETTWGATVPLAEAIQLFRLAAQRRHMGKAWEPHGLAALKCGDFAVTRIGPTGNMVVGCHDIPFRFAKVAADLAGISLS